MRVTPLLVLVLSLGMLATPAASRTWHVPSDAPSIQAGLDSAAAPGWDTVLVAAGTYFEPGLSISTSNLVLAGTTGIPGDVIIDAQMIDRVLDVDAAISIKVRGLTFRNGLAAILDSSGHGGALLLNAAFGALVENCVFENDSASGSGGAIACVGFSSATFRNCVFHLNAAAGNGGAISATGGGQIMLDSCSFDGNRATRGGALHVQDNIEAFILGDSRFEQNLALEHGGAISCDWCTLTVSDALFTQNSAGSSGGAIWANEGWGRLSRCLFSHNHASGPGGGGALYLAGSMGILSPIFGTEFSMNTSDGPGGAIVFPGPGCANPIDSCSFTSNQADSAGGAVLGDGNGSDWVLSFERCVFSGNQSGGAAAVGVRNVMGLNLASCTVVGNDPGSESGASVAGWLGSTVSIQNSVLAFAASGRPVSYDPPGNLYVSCTDVYGNAAGDWDQDLAPLDSIQGNFHADPLFCGPDASPLHPYMLQGASPCATDTCGLIGGEDVGCGFLKNWSGLGDDQNWEDPENWDPVGVPGLNDDVRIAKPGMEFVFLSSPAAVFRLTVGGPLSNPTLVIVSNMLEISREGTNLASVEIQEGAALDLPAGVPFVNLPGAVVRLTGGDLIGEGVFVNGGDVRKSGPELTSRIGVAFENRVGDPGNGWLYVEEGVLEVTAPLTNTNSIRLYPSAAMILDPGDGPLRADVITNTGLVVVELGASIVLQTPTTVFMNMGTGIVELQGGDVTGAGRFRNFGLVRKTDPELGGRLLSSVSARFENAVGDPGDGAVRVEEGRLAIEEVFDNAGSLYVYTSARLALDPGEGPLRADLLTNTGVLILRDDAVLSIDPAGTVFWNTAVGEVRLQGTAEILGAGMFRNHGLFVKEEVGKGRAFGHVAVLFENVGDDPGDGAIQVSDGDLWVEGELTNTGSIAVNSGANLLLDPGEGPLRKGGLPELGDRTNGVLTNCARGACDISGSLEIADGATFTNDGLVMINDGASIENDGLFDLRENGVLAGRGTFDNTGGSFTGAGVIRPGGSAGTLSFLGDFSQTATGEIEVEIGGTAPGTGYDRLAISGTATLDGALYTTLVGAFTPVEGDSFAVITIGGGLAGRTDFDCFSGLDVPGSLFLEPVQVPAAFSLVARDSTASNGPPAAGDDGDSTNAATPITIHVLTNDTDPEMNDLRVALVSTAGTSGTVAILPGDSLLLYTPVRSFSGQDAFTYTVTDCGGGTDVATVTIGVARAPHAWLVPAGAPTIAAGLDSAWAKDTVVVGSGTYHEHGIVMKSGVVLRSETLDPASVVIDADSLDRVLSCTNMDSTTKVIGITLTGGNAAGGGAYVSNSDMTFDSCVFRGNAAPGSYGGGVRLVSGRPVVRRCLLEGNYAQYGGGMGIYGSTSTALIESTLIVNNVVSNAGGAAYVESGAHPTFRNCTITGNACLGTGSGGFHVFGLAVQTVVELEHTILASNTSGPMSNVAHCATNAAVHASCCDIYGNSGDDYAGCLAGQQSTNGNFSADPRFCQFGKADDPYALMSGSPCAPANNPSCGLVGARPVGCGAVTGVEDAAPPAVAYRLFANRPNPFNPTTTIRFSLPRAERAVLVVYDVSGRRVATIADGRFGPGEFDATWNGTDEAGRDVASGIYFARLAAGEYTAVRKMVLLR